MEKIKTTSLDLEDEINLHQKGWNIQRAGWAVILLLLVASALGLFGSGLLSSKELTANGNTIRFEKLARFESPMHLRVNAKSNNGKIEVRIPQSYLKEIELDKIVPEPVDQRLKKEQAIFIFEATDFSFIDFYLIPEKAGPVKAVIQVNESNFSVNHFIYP
jgi:hypothetical protein